MTDFSNREETSNFACKLWRGEKMTMLGFDVKDPEADLVGFSIEVKAPGATDFIPLKNRLNFSYPTGAGAEVNGNRNFASTEAPFQKFRWIHFPWNPVDGRYEYRVTKQHMPRDNNVVSGESLTLGIDQSAVTYDGLLDVGFTRNFASSQAYGEIFGNRENIIPSESKDGLSFDKNAVLPGKNGEDVYKWLGFEAYELLFSFLRTALNDPSVTLDALAYDLNEPEIVDLLGQFGSRLRIIIDDSKSRDEKTGLPNGHDLPDSAESKSADRLAAKGASVTRMHFQNLQHNKVFIVRRDGAAERVLCGSTNFTFRGLYIQANNVLVFNSPGVAALYGKMFEHALDEAKGIKNFKDQDFAKRWHVVSTPGKPTVRLCFSPHLDPKLSLSPIAAALDQASSSALYSVAFLSQMKSGPTFDAFNRVIQRSIFSCGSVDQAGKMAVNKPDGTKGVVDFKYLAKKAPAPFAREWSGGGGRHIHHKFLVTDFNLPSARLFTGSSNFSVNGEKDNGDNLIMIEDRKIATAYAIEAMRIFDHLLFRTRMQDAFGMNGGKLKKSTAPAAMTLRKPTSISGENAWFERFYAPDSQALRDRKIFSE